MRNPYIEIVNALRAGYSIWSVMPLLEKLPKGFYVSNPDGGYRYSSVIRWIHPNMSWDCRHELEVMQKDKFDETHEEYRDFMAKFIFALESWANEPEASTIATSTKPDEKPEFRKRDKQALADWIDGYRKDNSPIDRPTLARKYFRYLRQGNKKSSYLKGKPVNESKSIEAITRTIGEIDSERAARNQK